MIFRENPPAVPALRAAIRLDEAQAVRGLIALARPSAPERAAIDALARRLVEGVRASHRRAGGVEVRFKPIARPIPGGSDRFFFLEAKT